MESYWACPKALASLLQIEEEKAKCILKEAFKLRDSANADKVFRNKRKEIYNRIPAYKSGDADQVGADAAREELSAEDPAYIYVGKELVSSIREVCDREGIKGAQLICKKIPANVVIADDLRVILQNA